MSMEMRKFLAFRSDFWVQFVGGFAIEFLVSFLVWKTVYSAATVTGAADAAVIRGMRFDAMVFFYIVAPLLANISHGQEMHFISRDIYDGSLSRYIVYPVPFLRYKYLTHLSYGIMGVIQAVIIIGLFTSIYGIPAGSVVTAGTIAAGIVTSLLTGILYFSLASAVEMVAFWADAVWSLMVMLKFIVRLLGGGMIPLVIYPEWAQGLLRITPFYYLINFPIQTALGNVNTIEWLRQAGITCLWIVFFAWISSIIWQRGSREYSGVGI